MAEAITSWSAPLRGGPTPTLTPTPTPGTFEVHMFGSVFVPDTITIPVGATVIWTNFDFEVYFIHSHTHLFESGGLSYGDSFSYTFTQPGVFLYHVA